MLNGIQGFCWPVPLTAGLKQEFDATHKISPQKNIHIKMQVISLESQCGVMLGVMKQKFKSLLSHDWMTLGQSDSLSLAYLNRLGYNEKRLFPSIDWGACLNHFVALSLFPAL